MSSKASDGPHRNVIPPLQVALQAALGHMNAINGVDGAIIASRDGLLVAGGPDGSEPQELKAAIAAAIFATIDRAAESIDLGPVRATLVETPTSSLQMLSIAELLFVVVARKNANMARIRAGMAEAAGELARQARAG